MFFEYEYEYRITEYEYEGRLYWGALYAFRTRTQSAVADGTRTRTRFNLEPAQGPLPVVVRMWGMTVGGGQACCGLFGSREAAKQGEFFEYEYEYRFTEYEYEGKFFLGGALYAFRTRTRFNLEPPGIPLPVVVRMWGMTVGGGR
ncbi:MAG: hypothetical protein ACKO3T_06575 [Planctomycetaceae bacterium]